MAARIDITKVGYWRKDVLEGHTPCALIYSAKDVCAINFTGSVYLYLYLKRLRSVSVFRRWVTWLWHFRDPFPARDWRKANSWQRSVSSNPGNWMCGLILFLPSFLSFLFSCYFSIFCRSNAYTRTNKGGAKRRGKDFCVTRGVHLVSDMIWFVQRVKNPWNCS